MFSRLSFGGLSRISEESLEMSHPHGKPITVHSVINHDEIITDFNAIEKIFNHPEVKNRKIVLFSIIGAFRRGKSFFLNYCLRYLYSNYKSTNYPDNPCNSSSWIDNKYESLIGFSWKAGVERVTSGIVIWSDIFLHTVDSTGEKLAIVVMDTQGLFDNETTPIENSRIFALGTLISSIQILNLSNLVQEDQLQYLQFATEFAKYAGADSCKKPFQNLWILIRDWSNCDQYEYGIEGGREYLRHILKIKPNQKSELVAVRQFIRDSFENVSCALLPHPGKSVSGGARKKTEEYDGRWSSMDPDFKDELINLVEHLLTPKNLVVKKINNTPIKCSDFKKYMMNYFTLFASNELPQTQSIYESTVENQMNMIVSNCLETYKKTVYRNEDLITNVNMISIVHDNGKREAIIDYEDAHKMGNFEIEEKFKKILCKKIEDLFQLWGENSEKNLDKLEEERKKLKRTIDEKEIIEREQEEDERRAAERLDMLEDEYAKKLEEAYRKSQNARVNAENELKKFENNYEGTSKGHNEVSLQDLTIAVNTQEIEQIYKLKKEIAELRLKNERSELARIRAERKRQEATRKRIAAAMTMAKHKKEIEGCRIF